MDMQENLYIIIDLSDSMKGQSIGSANDIAANIVLHFRDTVESNPLASGSVKVISVGDNAKLIANKAAQSFEWNDVLCNGLSNIGEAYGIINSSIDQFSNNIIVLISDGGFTDDYVASLASLMDTPAFIDATRISVAVGTNYDAEQLGYFCGVPHNLVTADDIDKIINMISNALWQSPNSANIEEVDSSENWD